MAPSSGECLKLSKNCILFYFDFVNILIELGLVLDPLDGSVSSVSAKKCKHLSAIWRHTAYHIRALGTCLRICERVEKCMGDLAYDSSDRRLVLGTSADQVNSLALIVVNLMVLGDVSTGSGTGGSG